ncbi:FUSC family protein [Georgenia sp. SUBG003]|uniref:FUSC family protein n=1 Tax=Georgenia sp. SUBG003 TaxID=1497974 RepID=UPI0006945F2B
MTETAPTVRDELIRRPGRFLRTWLRHPRSALAVRGALAASLAWFVVQFLPDPAADYPYYAPLGAVIATTTTLVGSVRESLQTVAAIAVGGAVGFLGEHLGSSDSPLTVALVVALGVLAAGLRPLGPMASWAPTAALFTLIIGGGEAFYIGVYAGLVLLGAAIGVAVNAVFPPLPLAPAQAAVADVRRELAAQLADVADALDQDDLLDAEGWERRQHDVAPNRWLMRTKVQEADDARRGNRRARAYAHELDRLDRQAAALDRVALLVVDLTDLLAVEERAENETLALGRTLRPAAADMVRHLEAVVRSVGDPGDAAEEVRRTRESMERFKAETGRVRTDEPGGGIMVAASLAVTIRRCLDELASVGGPDEPAQPSDAVRAPAVRAEGA